MLEFGTNVNTGSNGGMPTMGQVLGGANGGYAVGLGDDTGRQWFGLSGRSDPEPVCTPRKTDRDDAPHKRREYRRHGLCLPAQSGGMD